jgi:hypothetical protein
MEWLWRAVRVRGPMRTRRAFVRAAALALVAVAAIAGVALWVAQPPEETAPPSRPPRPPESCEGVAVSPRDDLAAALDAEPAGATFCFRAGRYELAEAIVPDDGDRLVAEDGAVLDGATAPRRRSRGRATTSRYAAS